MPPLRGLIFIFPVFLHRFRPSGTKEMLPVWGLIFIFPVFYIDFVPLGLKRCYLSGG